MTAWATLAAVVVALVLGALAEVRNTRDRRRQRDRDAATELRATRAQAQRVAAWMDAGSISPGGRPGRLGATAIARNASEEPVWNVTLYAPWERAFSDTNTSGDPKRSRTWVLPPGRDYEAPLAFTLVNSEGSIPVQITFRDNAGAWWERDTKGILTKLDGPPTDLQGTAS
ncbi:hypothetical protein Cch01nite_16660 [Cellulomonas chitinilytica]|uniref:Uncharacterized protein n=1 Tax=Cellulomonas chitinilytica TaxID=398759 RepID=A0A919P2I7_9CELL|nr:hypothetical protein Cch01nite_16660 [Cellulomonas chitinilytica]